MTTLESIRYLVAASVVAGIFSNAAWSQQTPYPASPAAPAGAMVPLEKIEVPVGLRAKYKVDNNRFNTWGMLDFLESSSGLTLDIKKARRNLKAGVVFTAEGSIATCLGATLIIVGLVKVDSDLEWAGTGLLGGGVIFMLIADLAFMLKGWKHFYRAIKHHNQTYPLKPILPGFFISRMNNDTPTVDKHIKLLDVQKHA